MRLAQSACRFDPYPELERGLYLFEHRRCFDEIIGFCNDLCYKGALQPMRGLAADGLLRPMGYLHVDGDGAFGGRQPIQSARSAKCRCRCRSEQGHQGSCVFFSAAAGKVCTN